MSTENIIEAAEAGACCASCGVAEIDGDGNKLKECAKCDLARYCRDKWLENHRKKHEAIRKKKTAELRDEILFKQPESSCFGDCPICFLPLPLDVNQSVMYTCCCKEICKGCDLANDIREEEEGLVCRCPFCRKEVSDKDEEHGKNEIKRAEAGDRVALRQIGAKKSGEGDYEEALKYLTTAAELGDAEAHFNLSVMYRQGKGVEKDEEREVYHLEEAAIAGHPDARFNLGNNEARRGGIDRAVKHFIIAANLGHDKSIQTLKLCYKAGHVGKDDLAAALRGHQAAVDSTKSPQREQAVGKALS